MKIEEINNNELYTINQQLENIMNNIEKTNKKLSALLAIVGITLMTIGLGGIICSILFMNYFL